MGSSNEAPELNHIMNCEKFELCAKNTCEFNHKHVHVLFLFFMYNLNAELFCSDLIVTIEVSS